MQSTDIKETLNSKSKEVSWGIEDKIEKIHSSINAWNPNKAKMDLAKCVLKSILLLSVISITIFIYSEKLGTPLLEICKTGLLPVVTLILGYYFSSVE